MAFPIAGTCRLVPRRREPLARGMSLRSCIVHSTLSEAIRIVLVSVTQSLSPNLTPVERSKWLRQNVEYVKHETLWLAAALGKEYSKLFAKARIAGGTHGSTHGVETPELPIEAVGLSVMLFMNGRRRKRNMVVGTTVVIVQRTCVQFFLFKCRFARNSVHARFGCQCC